MTGRLAGKVAVVTGGTGGIGQAIARGMLDEGAHAVVVTGRDVRRGAEVAGALGKGACFRPQDVTSEAGWDELTDWIRDRFGRLDVLVNNAGWVGDGDPQDPVRTTLRQWRDVMSVNLDSVFLGCRAAVRLMADADGSGGPAGSTGPARGCIVNISSTAGMLSTPAFVAYGAAKAAVAHLTRSVAVYCARAGTGIRCNAVHPALVDTALGDDVLRLFDADVERARQAYLARVPLGMLAAPEDVVGAVVYLASDEARYVTGESLVVGGGLGV
jgi:3(or 17)beta-hydroxysteroid dehydrogenase